MALSDKQTIFYPSGRIFSFYYNSMLQFSQFPLQHVVSDAVEAHTCVDIDSEFSLDVD